MLTKLEANRQRWLFDPDLEEKYTEIEIQLKRLNIENYIINDDGTIDVNGDVDLSNRNLTKIPIKLNKVMGSFNCGHNKLKSLEGAPISISSNFYCHHNILTSLKGAPTHIDGDFYCYVNNLTLLEGAPESVSGDFYCYVNNLTSFEGAPKYVGGDFWCSENYNHFTSEDVREICDVKGNIYC